MGLKRPGPATLLGLAGVASTLIAPSAANATPAGEAMADSCSGCHGGGRTGAGAFPRLDGWKAPALAAALRAFRDGPQPGTVMGRIARGFTDAEIDQLSAALAARTATPADARR